MVATYLVLNRARLKTAATAAGLTLSEIAAALSIRSWSFDDRARGRVRWRHGEVERLERLLGVSIGWLEGDGDGDGGAA